MFLRENGAHRAILLIETCRKRDAELRRRLHKKSIANVKAPPLLYSFFRGNPRRGLSHRSAHCMAARNRRRREMTPPFHQRSILLATLAAGMTAIMRSVELTSASAAC